MLKTHFFCNMSLSLWEVWSWLCEALWCRNILEEFWYIFTFEDNETTCCRNVGIQLFIYSFIWRKKGTLNIRHQNFLNTIFKSSFGYKDINLTSSWYEPMYKPTKLHPPHLLDQFCTAKNEFYNMYKHFMPKFLMYGIIHLRLDIGLTDVQ